MPTYDIVLIILFTIGAITCIHFYYLGKKHGRNEMHQIMIDYSCGCIRPPRKKR